MIGEAIFECLIHNNPEGATEVDKSYLNTLHIKKECLFLEADLPKTTAYHSFRNKNPTLKTLSKLLSAAHEQAIKKGAFGGVIAPPNFVEVSLISVARW